jgi:hypothetical protein
MKITKQYQIGFINGNENESIMAQISANVAINTSRLVCRGESWQCRNGVSIIVMSKARRISAQSICENEA